MPPITTPRCLIRHFTAEDVDAALRYLGDPEVMRFVEPPFDRAAAAAFIGNCGIDERLVLAVDCDEHLIGHIIWHPWTVPGVWELGWVLARDHWGRRLATELADALIAQARADPRTHRVVAETDPRNTASIRAIEHAGLARTPYLDQNLPVWSMVVEDGRST